MMLLPSHRHRNGGNSINEQKGEIPMWIFNPVVALNKFEKFGKIRTKGVDSYAREKEV